METGSLPDKGMARDTPCPFSLQAGPKATGYTIKGFDDQGHISLTDNPVMYDSEKLECLFKTPSGKIEIIGAKLTDSGLPCLKEYESPL